MEIVLYCPDTRNPDEIPVLNFFIDRYDDNFDTEENMNDLANILSTWKHVKDNGGKTDNWRSKKAHGFDFIEIRIKQSRLLLRFPYYLDSINNRMVVLLGYNKPDDYKPRGKIAKRIKRKQEQAQEYYRDHHKDRNKMIELPKKFDNLMNNNN